MSVLTVFLGAADAVPRAVRDILRDWSAVGLVTDFVWVDEVDVDPSTSLALVPADLVLAGGVQRAGLQEHLANRTRLDGVRICVVSALGGTAGTTDPAIAGHIRNSLHAGLPEAEVAAAHVVITRHGAGGWDPAVAWLAWQTIVVAPEDAWTPGRDTAAVQLTTAVHPAEFAAHAATAVASLCGLWVGIGRSALDDGIGAGISGVRLTRSFVRFLDAGLVSHALRDELADLSRGFPRPRVSESGHALPYLADPIRAGASMRDAVVDRNAEIFTLTLEPTPKRAKPPVTGWTLLVSFLGFLWAALRSAPHVWLDRQLDRGRASMARRVERTVFGGAEVSVQAMVGGVTSDGRRLSLDDQAREIQRIGDRVRQDGLEIERRRPQLSRFWSDVASGAMTLADGDNRLGDGQVLAGLEPGIVQWPDQIAPDPASVFRLPGALHDADLGEIHSTDVLQIRAARIYLDQLAASSDHHAQLAGSTLQQMDSWFGGSPQRAPRYTYLVQVGMHIGKNLDGARQQLAGLLQELKDAAAVAQVPLGVAGSASTLARRLRWGTALGAGAAAVLAVVGLVKWGWLIAVALAMASGAVFLIAGLLAWRRARQAEFALLFQIEDEDRIRGLQHNIVRTADYLYQLMGVYSQYLAWAPVLGRFLAEPFGARTAGEDAGLKLRGRLPRSMGLGVARPVQEQIRITADDVRPALFRPGWLGPYWDRMLQIAAARATRDTRALVEPHELLADDLRAPDSPLRAMSSWTIEHGVPAELGAALWDQACRRMAATGNDRVVGTLFSHVDVVGRDQYTDARQIPGSEFLTQLVVGAGDSRRFDPMILTGPARVNDQTGVSESVVDRRDPSAAADDLDQMVVVVQLSAAVPPEQVILSGGSAPAPRHGSNPPLEPTMGDRTTWKNLE
jgi:hypothetical protein